MAVNQNGPIDQSYIDKRRSRNGDPGGSTAPTNLAAAPVGSGGTFAAGTYFWKVTAVNAGGESIASNEATATLALNGSVNLTWTAVPGATSYKVYRGTATNAENVLVASPATNSLTDTGAAGTAGAPPVGNFYSSVADMRARLFAISNTTFSQARLDAMTTNDMVYALRQNTFDSAGI